MFTYWKILLSILQFTLLLLLINLVIISNELPLILIADVNNYTISFTSLTRNGIISTCPTADCQIPVPSTRRSNSTFPMYYIAGDHTNVTAQLKFIISGTYNSSSVMIEYQVNTVNQEPQLNQTSYTFNAQMDSNATIQLYGGNDRESGSNVVYVITSWNGLGDLYLNNGNVSMGVMSNSIGAVVAKGSTSVDVPLGKLTYRLNGNYGQTSFTIKVRDTDGLLSNNVSTIIINVARVNYPAIANSLSVQVRENITSTLTLSGTDANSDDHPLTFTICTVPQKGSLTQTTGGSAITAGSTISAPTFSGLLSSAQLNYFIPFPYSGLKIDYFSFSVTDQHGSTSPCVNVSIDVNTTHIAPTATGPVAVQQVNEDTTLTITLTGNDVNSEPLTYWIVSTPQSATLKQVNSGNLIDTSNGPVQVFTL